MYVGVVTLFTLFVLGMGVIASLFVATLAGIMEHSVSEGKAMFIHFITLGGK
jgi:hypothetical protein